MVRTVSFLSPEPQGSLALVGALMTGGRKGVPVHLATLPRDGAPARQGLPASLSLPLGTPSLATSWQPTAPILGRSDSTSGKTQIP